jgi:putative endonuclease
MYYVYVLFSKTDRRCYIGFTRNLKQRVREHQWGKVASTKKRKTLQLVFYEAFINKSGAERRERYFKTTKGKRTLKLILSDTLGPVV